MKPLRNGTETLQCPHCGRLVTLTHEAGSAVGRVAHEGGFCEGLKAFMESAGVDITSPKNQEGSS